MHVCARAQPTIENIVIFHCGNLFGALATTGTSMLIDANGTGIIFPLAIVATIPTIGLILLLRRLEGANQAS